MDTILDLTNPEFTFKFDGQDFLMRKASIRQVIAYQQRVLQIQKESAQGGAEYRAAAFAVFLLLKEKDSELTEEAVLDKMRGDIDLLDLLAQLGFMNPEKVQLAKDLQNGVIRKLTGDKSSPSSATELDGAPTKLEN